MRVIFFIPFLFFWNFTVGQSSAIGLHIGNVPQCSKIAENQGQDNTITSSQCYSLGLSYHRAIKNHLFFGFRLQYQNMAEEVAQNTNTFFIPGREDQLNLTNITNRSHKEIILLPNIYWTIGEHKLQAIMGFGFPIRITGPSSENIFQARERIFQTSNGFRIKKRSSTNDIIQDGGVAFGLMALLGMSYQLNKRIQLRLHFTPTLYIQHNNIEIKRMYTSQQSETIIIDGNRNPSDISNYSSDRITDKNIRSMLFQEDVFLFSLLFKL